MEKSYKGKIISTHQGIDIRAFEQSNFTNDDEISAKRILILGQSGDGVSTFVFSMINYLKNVDLNDNFRYGFNDCTYCKNCNPDQGVIEYRLKNQKGEPFIFS